MNDVKSEEKKQKHLSYHTVLIIGIALLLVALIVGGIIGNAIHAVADIVNLVAIIMIIIQTFKKNVSKKTKLTGWGLIVLWLIVKIIVISLAR